MRVWSKSRMKVVLNIFSNPMQHIIKARQNSLGTIQFSAVYRSQESNIGGTWVLNRTPGQSHMQNLNSYIFFLNFLSDYILTYCNPSVPLLFLSGQEVAEKSRLLTCISLWAYITSPSPLVHSKKKFRLARVTIGPTQCIPPCGLGSTQAPQLRPRHQECRPSKSCPSRTWRPCWPGRQTSPAGRPSGTLACSRWYTHIWYSNHCWPSLEVFCFMVLQTKFSIMEIYFLKAVSSWHFLKPFSWVRTHFSVITNTDKRL